MRKQLRRPALATIVLISTMATCALLSCSGGGSPTSTTPVPPGPSSVNTDVLTYYNDNARSGVQSNETALTTANVNAASFGKIARLPVDGFLFAQPLFVANYTMNDAKQHNIVFAATAHGTVYAFDADGNNPSAGYYWKTSLIPAGEQTVTPADYFGCHNPAPESVIIGTPVIDRTAGQLFVVAKTKSASGGSTNYIQRLYALNLADGTQKQTPTVITATVPGTGDGSVNGSLTFNALTQNQRASLALVNGSVWIAYASHCDIGPYHGWVLGYNEANIAQQTAVFNNTPNGSDGGIWMGQGGISADSKGNLFFVAGNGTFDANTGGPDLSDAATKLAISNAPAPATPPAAQFGLTVADWFVPSDQGYLSPRDLDVGTNDAVLFQDPNGLSPNLLATADKTGRLYLVDRDNMGKYQAGKNGPDGLNADLQDFVTGGPLFGNFAFFNNTLYVGANGAPLEAYALIPGTATTRASLNTTPASQTTFKLPGGGPAGGAFPTISANVTTTGSSNAIVWTVDNSGSHAILHAYDATNLATELYNSTQASGNRDQADAPVKFASALIANGKVYVPGQSSVTVYGLIAH